MKQKLNLRDPLFWLLHGFAAVLLLFAFSASAQTGMFYGFNNGFGNPLRPSYYQNFLNNGPLDASITYTRAGNRTCINETGVRVTLSDNQPCFNHTTAGVPLGFLIEQQATNFLLNSTSPATQTTGSLSTGTYTLWVEGTGTATMSAGTATGCGTSAASNGVPVNFTITVAGTCTVTVAGSVTVFQLENSPFATSLIITAGATATRNADVAYVASIPWYNAASGTFFAAWSVVGLLTGQQIIGGFADSGFSGNELSTIFIDNAGARLRGQVSVGGVSQAALLDTADYPPVAGTAYKSALAIAQDDFAYVQGGIVRATDSSGSVSTSLTRLFLGSNGTGSFLNGHLRSLAYYGRRLSNEQIQGITS